MSVIPSNNAWRRVSDTVRDSERNRAQRPGGRRLNRGGAQPGILVRITVELGDGRYEAEEVRGEGTAIATSTWEAQPNGRTFTDTDGTALLELNETTGVDIGTITLVEMRSRFDTAAVSTYDKPIQWVFNLGGGGGSGSVPARIRAKLEDGLFDLDVFADGSQAPVTDTTDSIIRIPQLAAGEVIPSGTWIMASQIGEDDTYPTKTHYEAQVPVWL